MTDLCSQTTILDAQSYIASNAEVPKDLSHLRSIAGWKFKDPVLDVSDSYEQKFYDALMSATLQAIADRQAV